MSPFFYPAAAQSKRQDIPAELEVPQKFIDTLLKVIDSGLASGQLLQWARFNQGIDKNNPAKWGFTMPDGMENTTPEPKFSAKTFAECTSLEKLQLMNYALYAMVGKQPWAADLNQMLTYGQSSASRTPTEMLALGKADCDDLGLMMCLIAKKMNLPEADRLVVVRYKTNVGLGHAQLLLAPQNGEKEWWVFDLATTMTASRLTLPADEKERLEALRGWCNNEYNTVMRDKGKPDIKFVLAEMRGSPIDLFNERRVVGGNVQNTPNAFKQ